VSDILTDAQTWLDTPGRLENIGTHGEECHRWHVRCLVSRLVDEVARLREERDTLLESEAWGVNCKPSKGPEGDG